MKKVIGLSLFGLLLGTMIACSNGAEETQNEEVEDEVIYALEVELTVTEEVDVNEKVLMVAAVSMGDEKIENADKVVFEVWEEGKKDEAEMIDSVNEEDGTYTAETTFKADGLFHIQSHVDARAQHTMPLKAVTVGSGGNYEAVTEEGEEAHAEGFFMNFTNPETIQVNKEEELMVLLEFDGEAFEGANVRYEIWNPSAEGKHDWVDAEELKPGEYTAFHTILEAGTFNIQVHVEDDDGLHEHEVHEIIVES